MLVSDRPRFGKLFERLCAAFGKDVYRKREDIYAELFRPWEIDDVEAGTERAMLEERTFPTPRGLAEWVRTVQRERIQAAQATAEARVDAADAGEVRDGPWCVECDDTGWASRFERPAVYGGEVEIRRVHRCRCWASNPVRLVRRTW